MRSHSRLVLAAVALALCVALPGLAGAATHKKPPVKQPKSGAEYSGHHPGVGLRIGGKSIEIIAFRFPCHKVKGNTSLQDIPIKKTKKGWRFDIKAHGIVTYSDTSNEHPDENAAIAVSGRFSRNAKSVSGHVRIQAPRCDSGKILWSATR
jgi:hypothetical protein